MQSTSTSVFRKDHPLMREAMLAKMMSDLLVAHKAFLTKVEELATHAQRIKNLPPGEKGEAAKVDYGRVVEAVLRRIPTPKDGETPDLEAVAEKVMGRIRKPLDGKSPIINKSEIAGMVLKLIPKPTAQTIDPDSLIEKLIEKLTDGKTLKVEHVAGLRPEIDSYRNQLAGKSYGKDTWARGGGDTVTAGTGIAITTDVNGKKVISAPSAPGTNIWGEQLSGPGTVYTLAHTSIAGTVRIYRGGARQNPGAGNDYTISGSTVTFAVALATGEIALADYAY